MPFPQELFDMVIDEASKLSDKAERTRALVALSLVSRAFRERAQNHLFRSITLNNGEHAMEAGRRLLDLLDDPNTKTMGLASKITSFSCCIPQVDAGALGGILGKLFTGHGKPCSLYLHFISGTQWPSLPETTARSLFQVCHRPRLASLFLRNLHDIPRNFLQNSCIKRLSLHDVSVCASQLPESFFEAIAGQGHHDRVILEFLYISVEKPVLTLSLLTMSQQVGPTVVFSNLRELCFVSPFRDVEPGMPLKEILMGCKESLEVLKITLKSDTMLSLILPGLHNLHTLRLSVASFHSSNTPLSDLARFLKNPTGYYPNLRTVELELAASGSRLLLADESILQTFERLGCTALDELFVQQRFHGVRNLSLRCWALFPSPQSLSRTPVVLRTPEEYEILILSRFPRVSSRENLRFSVHVTIRALQKNQN